MSQAHGKRFEDVLKALHVGSSDTERSATSKWDIESKFDDDGYPISIKTKKISPNMSIEMADARRFMENTEPFKLLIGMYDQINDRKSFFQVMQIIIKEDDLKKIKSELTLSDVEHFHNELKSYPEGDHAACRKFAKKYKADLLKQKEYNIILNAKIDSKKQRRLQCSLSLNELLKIIPKSQIKIFDDSYKELVLPLTFISEKRQIKQSAI